MLSVLFCGCSKNNSDTDSTQCTDATQKIDTTENEATENDTTEYDTTETEEDVYNSYVGQYAQSEDFLKYSSNESNGHLTVLDSSQEVEIRFFGAKKWTVSQSCDVLDDGKLQVKCEYYYSEAEPDDLLEFTLEKTGTDEVLLTVIESEYPFLEKGETVLFEKFAE